MPTRTFQYRLYPTEAQEKRLQVLLDVSRHVYNMALEERQLLYELEATSASKKDSYELAKRNYSASRGRDGIKGFPSKAS